MNFTKTDISVKLGPIIKEKGNLKKFKAHEMIFMEDDRDDCLFYVDTGLVKLSMISNEGKEKTLFILSGGQFFGEVSMVDGLKHAVNAEALSGTVIYTINYKEIIDLLQEQPDIALELLRVMAEKMRVITQQVKDMVFYDIPGRLASQILTFYQQFGVKTEEGMLIDLVLTHQELANILGASRVTVTKALNQFHEEGLIKISNRKIIITDIQLLMDYIR